MQQSISKLCADSLRALVRDKYGIKLKAAHAHELVAAYLGYRSKNALLAEKKYPISDLANAERTLREYVEGLYQQEYDLLESALFVAEEELRKADLAFASSKRLAARGLAVLGKAEGVGVGLVLDVLIGNWLVAEGDDFQFGRRVLVVYD